MKGLSTWLLTLTLIYSLPSQLTADERPYDEVVSLGYGCQVAAQMSVMQMRKQAYPFDWLVTSLNGIAQFIANKGAHFLDPNYLSLEQSLPGAQHCVVKDLKYEFRLIHDFTPPFLNDYSYVKARYERRIDRLFKLLESDKRILFIRAQSTPKEIAAFDAILHGIYPNLSYTIAVLQNDKKYDYDWGLERVKNFYITHDFTVWNTDYSQWHAIFRQFPLSAALAESSNTRE